MFKCVVLRLNLCCSVLKCVEVCGAAPELVLQCVQVCGAAPELVLQCVQVCGAAP